ncbi:hypothetical protein [Streptomyces sp. NPDC001435]|uniref:hypothetical protein n=2 Tax=unclassified Streptomyces TaxID=2593676 RepID=UPI00368B30E8
MANGVWHRGYNIEVNLSLPDLGHPDRPGLLDEIMTSVAERDPELLECLAHHDGNTCESEAGGKSPWMFVRRGRVGGRRPLVAAHLPVTHKPSAAETDQHKATKERVVATALRHGLEASAEQPVRGTGGRGVADALVTGPDGTRIGWEIQYYPLSPSAVHRRSVKARDNGVMPLWVTKSDRAALIDRAPWARVDDMDWQDIADGREMLIRGGFRHLQTWRCVPSSVRHCLEGSGGHCGSIHADWFLPALCEPPKPPIHIEDLIVTSATGESLAVFVPSRHNPRTGRHMWVPVKDCSTWKDMAGPTRLPKEPSHEPDDDITFSSEELDRSCRAGEEHLAYRSDPRPLRDFGQPTGGLTLPVLPMRPANAGAPVAVTDPERAAMAAALDCKPWELGPCIGCGQFIRRFGRNAPMACRACREAWAGSQAR